VPFLLWLIGVIALAALVALSIGLHEVGHLVPAKRFGVKVTQYMIGFGPTVLARQRGETEYGLKAIPLGGYIRMIGMFPPDKDGRVRESNTGRIASLVQDAREASWAEISPDDEPRTFYRLPVRQRLIIMIGGPFMNLVLAFVFFAILLCGIGLPTRVPTVSQITACVPTTENPTGAATNGACPGSVPSPASQVGLKPGDTIVSINGTPIDTWESFTAAMKVAGPGPATVVVQSPDGSKRTLTPTFAEATRPAYDDEGKPTGQNEVVPFLGMSGTIEYQRQSPAVVPGYIWDLTVRSVGALISLPVRVYELARDTFTGAGRSEDSPVSVVGVGRLGGDVAASSAPVVTKVAGIIGLAGSLNLFLFLFNLLPILPLDGGHVAGALYEGVRRRIAKWRNRPDPGPVDVAKALPVAYAVTAVMLLASMVIIWADVVNPLRIT